MDFTAITAAADYSAVLTAVGGVAAALAAVYIGIAGWKILKGVLKSS